MAQPHSLQNLCIRVLANASIREICKLPIHLRRDVVKNYEEKLRALADTKNTIVSFPDIDYCCRGGNSTCLNEFEPGTITNGYFVDIYNRFVKEHCYQSRYCEDSGYSYELYAPDSISFTTHSGDEYQICYDAYTSNNCCTSNWDRLINISRIVIRKNDDKETKSLPFVFVYDIHGEAIAKSTLNISHIRLDSSMNYVSHDIDDYTSNINEKKFKAQLKMLLEMQKISTLPFFVLFLEHIEDPIMRLIYLFTYMPSLKVLSGK